MKGDFNIGDQVKHWRNGQMGTVVKLDMSFTTLSGKRIGGLVGVKFDDRALICRQGSNTLLLIERARPTAPTGSDMTMLKGREWETSYTKKVVDALEKAHPISIPGDVAAELLRQYHRDLHLPYEQRDEALAKFKYQLKLNDALNKDITRQSNKLKELKGDLQAVQAHLAEANNIARGTHKFNSPYGETRSVGNRWAARNGYQPEPFDFSPPAPKKQVFMACGHYPNALSNFFEKRDHCEFCCEKEPLKWCDNGRHREPGK